MFGFTFWDFLIGWGILSVLIFVFLIWPMLIVAGRSDEDSGNK